MFKEVRIKKRCSVATIYLVHEEYGMGWLLSVYPDCEPTLECFKSEEYEYRESTRAELESIDLLKEFTKKLIDRL